MIDYFEIQEADKRRSKHIWTSGRKSSNPTHSVEEIIYQKGPHKTVHDTTCQYNDVKSLLHPERRN